VGVSVSLLVVGGGIRGGVVSVFDVKGVVLGCGGGLRGLWSLFLGAKRWNWGGDLNRGWAFGGVVTWWGLEKVGMSLNVCWVVFRHDG
jgi:hypothetical protein